MPYADLTNPQSLNLYQSVKNDPETFVHADGQCCDLSDVINFVTGAANAYGSDNLGGVGRQQQDSNAGKFGQAVGDAIATFDGGEKMVTGGGVVIASVAADSTGLGAIAGVPAGAAGVVIAGQDAVEAYEGSVNIVKDVVNAPAESRRTGDLTPGEKNQMDQENAAQNGGQNKCTECRQNVEKIQNKRGESVPGNQLQRHHDLMLSKAGNSRSLKNGIVCKNCHAKIHQQQPPQGSK